MRAWRCAFVLCVLVGCGGSDRPPPNAGPPPPEWLYQTPKDPGRICGIGIAGRSFYKEHAETMAADLAIRDLAAAISTQVRSAMIDTSTTKGQQVDTASLALVPEASLEAARASAEVLSFFDARGSGPLRFRDFTYAIACADVRSAASTVAAAAGAESGVADRAAELMTAADEPDLDDVPMWVITPERYDGMACAVGLAQRTAFREDGFRVAAEAARVGLGNAMRVLIGSSMIDIATERQDIVEQVIATVMDATVEGAQVSRYWFDAWGKSPAGRDATYAQACVMSKGAVDVVVKKVEEKLAETPEDKPFVERVRKNAAKAFEALEAEEIKQSGSSEAGPES